MEYSLDNPDVDEWHLNGLLVEMTTQVEDQDLEKLWGILQSGFLDLNARSHEKQDMTREEFIADCASDGVYKYIARDEMGTPLGFLMAHNSLESITWADMTTQRELKQDIDPGAASYYVNTVVVGVDQRATRTVYSLMQGAFLDFINKNKIRDENGLAFFDCAEANYPVLANLIARACSSGVLKGVDSSVRELYIESLLSDGTKRRDPPNSEGNDALDRQHFYAVML